jgi:hypothetical protein
LKGINKLSLILGSHAHVPAGCRDKEFEFVYENKTRPFVSNLYRYSKIQAVLHYSGVLLYWIERNHPEFFMLIEDMVTRKQVELIGGGFYEPMFTLIPAQDRIGQIELFTTYLRKHFGKRPMGCWLPEMSWEQNLVPSLASSDMSYTFLSEEQFKQAGLKAENIYSPCITEDQGKIITVFPVSLSIQEALANKNFSQVFNELDIKIKDSIIISVFPDACVKNQGEAPDTAWNRFFEEISLSDNLVETTLPSKIIKKLKKLKKVSFPGSSSDESDFSPRKFVVDNQDSSGIYSKMIYTSVLINQLKGDKSRKLNAREELWKAQDSNLFSPAGKYRHELRKAAYRSLICAEKLTREKGRFASSIITYDFNLDGQQEYLFQDSWMNCYIQLQGACLFELDYLPKDWNYLDCGTNFNGLRSSFADVLLPADSINDNNMKSYPKNSRLCFNEIYEAVKQERKGKLSFKLSANENDLPYSYIEIEKNYFFSKDTLAVSYSVKNTHKNQAIFIFIPEINLSFAGDGDENTRLFTVDNGKEMPLDNKEKTADILKILDVKNEVQILLTSSKKCMLNISAVFNEKIYQAIRILPVFKLDMKSSESWQNEFTLKFSH